MPRLPDWSRTFLPLFLLAFLAAIVLGPALWGDQALLPGASQQGMAPWAGAGGATATSLSWNPLLWDALAQFYPWRLFTARWIRQGVLPLWDPHQFCGTPFLANSQSALLYPLNWLIFLPTGLSVTRAMALVAWLHLVIAGSGVYFWLRRLGAASPAAFVAGLAFMLSGFTICWIELPTLLSVACWLPWLFHAVHRLIEARSIRSAVSIGLLIALTLLGGHLQIAFYCLLGAMLYGLAEAIRQRAPFGRVLAGAGPAGLLGLLLAAPHLLPAMELSRMSHRVGTPSEAGYAAYVAYAVPLGHLITLFLPDFYGNPSSRGGYWGAGNYTEYAGYTGVVTLLLALVALFGVRRRPHVGILASLALFALLMATGTRLNALFYFGVPGFGQSGSPGRILVLFCFAVACLAGLGLDGLIRSVGGGTDDGPPGPPIMGGAGRKVAHAPPIIGGLGGLPLSLLALPLLLLLFAGTRYLAVGFVARIGIPFDLAWAQSRSAFQAATALVVVAAAALLLPSLLHRYGLFPSSARWAVTVLVPALVVLDCWQFAAGFNPTAPSRSIYAETAAVRVLRERHAADPTSRILPINRRWSLTEHPAAVLPPNSGLALGLDDAQGYDSLFIGRYKGFANAIEAPRDSSPVQNGNMIFLSNLGSPLLPLLAARTIVTTEALTGRRAMWEGESVRIYDYENALPRAFLATESRVAATEEEELAELTRLAERGPEALRRTVILPAGTPQEPGTGSPSEASYRLLDPNTVEVAVRAARPSWLVVLDSYAPGWRAFEVGSDGGEKPVPLVRADFAFRGVFVGAGERRIRFRYAPRSFRLGLGLACIGLLGVVGWGIGSRKRAPTSPTPV